MCDEDFLLSFLTKKEVTFFSLFEFPEKVWSYIYFCPEEDTYSALVEKVFDFLKKES